LWLTMVTNAESIAMSFKCMRPWRKEDHDDRDKGHENDGTCTPDEFAPISSISLISVSTRDIPLHGAERTSAL
jgi:hypothetical protein